MSALSPPPLLPVLVWQMGKVGSTAICHALWKAGIWHLQTHSMHPDRLATLREEFLQRGLPVPEYVKRSEEYRDWMTRSSGPVRIITLVRDPVARNLSALFESWDTHPPDWSEGEALESLRRSFIETFDLSILRWFDTEIRSVTGIDIFSHPFDRATRSIRVLNGRFHILLLRAEDDDAVKQRAVRAFLENDDIIISRQNVTAATSRGSLYKTLAHSIYFPARLAAFVYATDYVLGCYDSDEIQGFLRKHRTHRRSPDPYV